MKVIQPSATLLVPIVMAVSLALSGCGLSEQLARQAQQTLDMVNQREIELKTSQEEFVRFQASDEYKELGRYAEREKWSQQLELAAQKLSLAKRTVQSEVQPLLDRDSMDDEYKLGQTLEKVSPMLASVREEAGRWRERRKVLEDAKKNADQLNAQAESDWAVIRDGVTRLQETANQAAREFKEGQQTIQRVAEPFVNLLNQSREVFATVEREHRSHGSGGDADYALLLGGVNKLESNREGYQESSAEAEAKFAQLSVSYSKTLIDMKADFFLTIRRQSWDESADYPSLHNVDYPAKTVDGQTYEHFDEIRGSLATFQTGWFSDDLVLLRGVDQNRWNSLKIDHKENWPNSDDNQAEYWVHTAAARYFHKYHVIRNGEASETDWVPVEEGFFLANLDNLGMDVESKPYGVFEENKLTHAAPPGMAYVGNPRYGRWGNQGGGSVWMWVAPYLLYRTLFGNPYRYGRNEWNTYRGGYYGSRPYYGGTAAAPAYGTRSRSTQSSPTLSSSNFGRSGGFNRPAGSVRGAGPAGRGGAFGGSGK